MERVSTLINRLKDQLQNNASKEQLLATTQLLFVELDGKNNAPIIKRRVSVLMPFVFNTITSETLPEEKQWIPLEIDPIVIEEELLAIKEETKEAELVTAIAVEPEIEKNTVLDDILPLHARKPSQASLLFDQINEIPTYVHQAPVSTETKVVYELNDVIAEEEEQSMNEKLKEEKTEVAHLLQGGDHVKDLKKAIGINDKYQFINELFRGDENMFERSIKTINGFNIYPEAQFWIQRELKTKLGWNEESNTVKLFDQLVKRRF